MEKHTSPKNGRENKHEFIPARFVEYSAELNMEERKNVVDQFNSI